MSGTEVSGTEATPVTESIGQLLVRLRAERGLDIAKAAQELRCDRAVIEALEADRYADLGAPVFARGHLRRYADLLGAPSADLLARWSAEQSGGQALPDLTRAPQAPRPIDTRRWGRLLAVVAGALAIGLAAWWILQGAGARPTPAADPRAVATPPQSVPVPEVAAIPPQETPPPAVVPSPMPPAVEPVDPPAEAPAPTAAPVAAVAAAGDVALAFTTQADCWAEVVDAKGTRRLYQLIRAGERVTASGAPPLRVTLGRGDVTRVEVGGRTVTLPQDAVRNAVARFEVAASGALRALPPVPSPASDSPLPTPPPSSTSAEAAPVVAAPAAAAPAAAAPPTESP
ncbi:MAG: RodZ domain-containing protein [Gammaproteobacteria bacterium]